MRNLKTRILAGVFAGALLAGPAVAQDKVRAAIGQRGLFDTYFIPLGVEIGAYKKEKIDVDITWTRGGAETLQAVITDSADLAVANGILGVIGAASKGAPVKIVSAQITGVPDLFWYVKADSAVKTMKDMNGRTMGYSRPGSSTHLVALALAEHAGVKPKFVSAGGVPDTRTQVMSGQIDAGWSSPPFNLDLVNEGKVRIVGRGTDLTAMNEQTVRVNVASVKFLKDKRDLARRFFKVYHETIEWVYANPEKAAASYAVFAKVTPDIALQTVKTFPKASVQGWPVKGLKQNIQEAVENKQLDKPMAEADAEKLLYDFPFRP
jgi:NitT/TauT family transport system substrate-binding protein